MQRLLVLRRCYSSKVIFLVQTLSRSMADGEEVGWVGWAQGREFWGMDIGLVQQESTDYRSHLTCDLAPRDINRRRIAFSKDQSLHPYLLQFWTL